jgi:DNA helicase-2/ATP-dependent DNA helicase PcrA
VRFHVDLHVHSKYSRATSRDLDLEHLAYWACRKGIGVVATGDFTHPAWRAEIKDQLVPAEPGLFRLRPELEANIIQQLPGACQTIPRFMLSVEISTIYKKGERTRKIHHLIYAPDFDIADRISASLARIGNITSDGRPILGLDSRHLLEITLESHPDAYLVPAHIWTPWFAVLGSQSGFESIVECYGDLSDHIFAVETGLSSDPPMNWRLSMLDRYRLVSNSDAHSPAKLGREATTFDTALDYFAIRDALKTGEGYVGTIEFFPEEGKYHLDGHRKCGVRLTPEETRAVGTKCPTCGGAMTIGVATRAASLSDRQEDAPPPETAGTVSNFVPLAEVLGEIGECGPGSKSVERRYDRLVSTLGAELNILGATPIEDIARADSTLLAEAITRLRAGRVICDAGYDGEYGVIRLFEAGEMKRLSTGGTALFDTAVSTPKPKAVAPLLTPGLGPAPSLAPNAAGTARAAIAPPAIEPVLAQAEADELPLWTLQADADADAAAAPGAALAATPRAAILDGLDADQRRAAEVVDGPLLIIAGPGSGKTRTLTHRIAHLIGECGVPAEACLAITFTRRAATEMRERLAQLLPGVAARIPIHTFHSLGLTILREQSAARPDAAAGAIAGLASGFRIASEEERVKALAEALGVSERKADTRLRAISKATRTGSIAAADIGAAAGAGAAAGIDASPELAEAIRAYRHALSARNWVDFDDLVSLPLRALAADPALAAMYRERFRWISVDEFQDLDEQQYRLLALLTSPDANVCAIGDPNQAIYGFRGADASCFERFLQDYPRAVSVSLTRNYRSTGTIVTAATQLLASTALTSVVREMQERITIQTTSTDRAEAEFVIQTIEQLLGGHNFFSIDSGRGRTTADSANTADGNATNAVPHAAALGFADIAVLFRTDAQADALVEAFERSGMPFKKHTHKPCAARPDMTDDDLALATEADFWDPRADRVSLLTLHAAKGLEFPIVFIVGLEDGVLPLYWNELDEEAAAEERRLLYVGMTRAEDRLFLSRAQQRMWRGRVQELNASRFLRDIESELTRHERSAPIRRRPEELQLRLL